MIEQQLLTMARYNQWMNTRLYAVCADIPDQERKADRGAFFKSIHGTLNHLLLGDRVWLARFRGEHYSVRGLDEEQHADFDALRVARERTDREILDWVRTLDEAALSTTLRYTTLAGGGQAQEQPLWRTVTHLLNHQTHHRGQLTTLLSQAGYDPGITDLIWLPDD